MSEKTNDCRHAVTPYLIVSDVARLAAFLKKAFDAEELISLGREDGSVMHVEMRIGDSMVMMGEPMGELGPMPASIYLTVEDCDSVYQRAVHAGGVSIMEPMDMPHAGERYGGVRDPAGNLWWVATQIEELTPEEQKARIKAGMVPSVDL